MRRNNTKSSGVGKIAMALLLALFLFVPTMFGAVLNSSQILHASATTQKSTRAWTDADLNAEAARLRDMKKVYAYLPSWGLYEGHELYGRPGGAYGQFDTNAIDFDSLTHLTYSFVKPTDMDGDNPGLAWDDPEAATTPYDLAKLIGDKMRTMKDKYWVFSLGGWTYSREIGTDGIDYAKAFERATNTPQKIDNFARNTVAFMKQYNFDGVDIDWEFPLDNTAKLYLLFIFVVVCF